MQSIRPLSQTPRQRGFYPTILLHPDGHPSPTHRTPDRCSEGNYEDPGNRGRSLNLRYTRKNLHRCAVGQGLVNSTEGGKLDAYNKHRVGDLVFTDSAPKNYHPGFSGRACELVQIADILHNIDYETWRPK